MSAAHKVIRVEDISKHTYRLVIERGSFQFKAGQCVNIGLPGHGTNREYSSYSSETAPELAFLIREVDDGTVSPLLRKLRPGDDVEIDGAYGDFQIPQDRRGERFLFIGTGTGIAPFHCFVKTFPDLDYKIIHGIRHLDERYDYQDYEGGKRYVGCVSREDGGDFKGRVTDYLRSTEIDPKCVHYLCGNRDMINEVYDLLRSNGVSGSNIITETFF